MKTVIIGIGNPVLTDDSVGIKVAQFIKERLKYRSNIDVCEAYAGGIVLMEAMIGYERAIIIDAMVTGNHIPGTVHTFMLSEISETKNLACTHNTNLSVALEIGTILGFSLPSEIRLLGIEAKDAETFGEELTKDVAKAVPVAAEKVFFYCGISNFNSEKASFKFEKEVSEEAL